MRLPGRRSPHAQSGRGEWFQMAVPDVATRTVASMELIDFESEYDAADLTVISGAPMRNSPLGQRIDAVAPAARVREALANLLGDAVFSYYFAKRVFPELERLAEAQTGPLRSAFEVVKISLVKQAVVGIASTIDLTTGRSRSIPETLDRLLTELTERMGHSPDDETQAAIELIRHIRSTTNADIVPSLKYVRHLRNKWASHSSLDRTVDSWADANTSVNFPLLEDALVRMINALQDLGILAPMSEELQNIEAQGRAGIAQPDGTERRPMTFAWTGVHAMATVMRGAAQEAGGAFIQRLV